MSALTISLLLVLALGIAFVVLLLLAANELIDVDQHME